MLSCFNGTRGLFFRLEKPHGFQDCSRTRTKDELIEVRTLLDDMEAHLLQDHEIGTHEADAARAVFEVKLGTRADRDLKDRKSVV